MPEYITAHFDTLTEVRPAHTITVDSGGPVRYHTQREDLEHGRGPILTTKDKPFLTDERTWVRTTDPETTAEVVVEQVDG
jgi:hypothetical protein